MEKIDIVLLWVDGSDAKWLKKISEYKKLTSDDEIRYRDYGTLKYIFRSIELYCPWVNRIHLITDKQIPEWLDLENEKINLIFHEDYIPQKYLPTFNSNVIELNLFRIKDLAEKFILFNDDTFLNSKVEPVDFFVGNCIKDFGIYNRIAPVEMFSHTLINNTILINKHFNRAETRKNNWKKQFSMKYSSLIMGNILTLPWKEIPGYYNHHLPQPHFKSTFHELYNLEQEAFEQTFKSRFRLCSDISHWLLRYWNLEKGRYVPQSKQFGLYLPISDMANVKRQILNGKSKVICINDVDGSTDQINKWFDNLEETFREKYPQKSTFEK